MKTTIIHILIGGLICFVSQVKAQNFPFHYLPPITIAPTFRGKLHVLRQGRRCGWEPMPEWNHTMAIMWKPTRQITAAWHTAQQYHPLHSQDHQDNLWLGNCQRSGKNEQTPESSRLSSLPDESQRIIYTLFMSKMELYGLELMADFPTSIPRQRRSIPIIIRIHGCDVDGSKNRITNYSVKAIIEDRSSDLLIGTWSSGLMRLKRGSNVFRSYPKLNDIKFCLLALFRQKPSSLGRNLGIRSAVHQQSGQSEKESAISSISLYNQ